METNARDGDTPLRKSIPLFMHGTVAGILWTLLIALSLVLNHSVQKREILEFARIEARTAFEKDVVYQHWNVMQGGVYVDVSDHTPPNPYMKMKDRDLETTTGRKLTLVNPAYMTRQSHELSNQMQGIKGHITSLHTIRPENRPDIWEEQALSAFARGVPEVSSVEQIDGQPYMRLMRPLIAEKSCRGCHAEQGYAGGDIRGGISASVPVAPFFGYMDRAWRTSLFWHVLVWAAGGAGLLLALFQLRLQIHRRQAAEARLHEQDKVQGTLEMAGAVCHGLNQPMQAAVGNAELLMMQMDPNDPGYEKVRKINAQVMKMGEITRKLMGVTRHETIEYPMGKIVDIDQSTGEKQLAGD